MFVKYVSSEFFFFFFPTLEALHSLLVCLALVFFSHHVRFEKAGQASIPQGEAGWWCLLD